MHILAKLSNFQCPDLHVSTCRIDNVDGLCAHRCIALCIVQRIQNLEKLRYIYIYVHTRLCMCFIYLHMYILVCVYVALKMQVLTVFLDSIYVVPVNCICV